MPSRLSVWLALLALLALPGTLPAQLASQTALVGTISDSNGGVLPGAQVVATNLGTKDTFEATTNAEGYYNIPFVRPGRYDVTVTLSGFQTFKATGVDIATNQVVRVNGVLTAGGITGPNVKQVRRVHEAWRAMVERAPQAQYTNVPGSGHQMPIEVPEVVSSAIDGILHTVEQERIR